MANNILGHIFGGYINPQILSSVTVGSMNNFFVPIYFTKFIINVYEII